MKGELTFLIPFQLDDERVEFTATPSYSFNQIYNKAKTLNLANYREFFTGILGYFGYVCPPGIISWWPGLNH